MIEHSCPAVKHNHVRESLPQTLKFHQLAVVEWVHDTKRATLSLLSLMPTPIQAPFSSPWHLEKKVYRAMEIPEGESTKKKHS